MPVQVDGEPWIEKPGEVVVSKSALKATMLRKTKMKRRNTEPALTSSEKGNSTLIQGEKSSIVERDE